MLQHLAVLRTFLHSYVFDTFQSLNHLFIPTAKPTLKPDMLYPLDNEKISIATSLPSFEARMLGF